MNKQIIPPTVFNSLSAADQLDALRVKSHNWGDYNATRALEIGNAQQQRFEAMAAKNTVNEDGTVDVLWA